GADRVDSRQRQDHGSGGRRREAVRLRFVPCRVDCGDGDGAGFCGGDWMTDDEKREHAEAIKHALGMGYGPPMEGEEGWALPVALPDEDDGWDVLYGVAEEERQEQERKLAKEREAAAEPKPAPPSDDPWAVIGKTEDDGEWIMKKVRDFG